MTDLHLRILLVLSLIIMCFMVHYYLTDMKGGRWCFVIGMLLTCVQLIIEWISYYLLANGTADSIGINIFICEVYFAIDITVPFLAFLMAARRIFVKKILIVINTVLYCVFLVLNFVNLFTGMIFTISPDNVYSHGPLFFISIALAAIYMIQFMVLEIRSYENSFRLEKILLVGTVMLIFAGTMLQCVFSTSTMWPFIAVGMMLVYIIMCNRQFQLDRLTGIPNRNLFQKLMDDYSKLDNVTIIMADMNCMKHINDTYGHHVGDDAICAVVSALEPFREYGSVCRLGGDEFCIICKSRIENETIEQLFDNAEINLKYWHLRAGSERLLSYGYDRYSSSGNKTIEMTFSTADKHMYEMKNAYKTRKFL